jgi:hypothetical protein
MRTAVDDSSTFDQQTDIGEPKIGIAIAQPGAEREPELPDHRRRSPRAIGRPSRHVR